MGNSGWVSTTIGALLARDGGSVKTGPFGTTLKAKEYSRDGVPLISVGEIGYGSLRVHDSTPRAPREVVERLPEYVLNTGDIVFGRKGAVDRSAMVKPEENGWFLGSDGIRLRLPATCDARFMAYQIQSRESRQWLLQHATGTTMASLNQGTIERLPIILPPMPEQLAVAHILGTLDDKIHLNERQNETLEAMARALFKSWFVDFDPVRDKAEGRESRLSGPIAALFPDSLSTINQHEIPSGWGYQSFASTVEIIGGGTPKTSVAEYWDGDIPWFSVVDAPSNSDVWVIDTQKRITVLGVENSSTQILPVGTTIISARGTVGRVALVGVPMAMNQSCYGLRGLSDCTGSYTYFSVRELVTSLQQHAHGSVFDTITRATLEGVGVVAPPEDVIKSFEGLTTDAIGKIRANLLESASLTKLRDLLLPGLLSGAVDLSSVRQYLGEAE